MPQFTCSKQCKQCKHWKNCIVLSSPATQTRLTHAAKEGVGGQEAVAQRRLIPHAPQEGNNDFVPGGLQRAGQRRTALHRLWAMCSGRAETGPVKSRRPGWACVSSWPAASGQLCSPTSTILPPATPHLVPLKASGRAEQAVAHRSHEADRLQSKGCSGKEGDTLSWLECYVQSQGANPAQPQRAPVA